MSLSKRQTALLAPLLGEEEERIYDCPFKPDFIQLLPGASIVKLFLIFAAAIVLDSYCRTIFDAYKIPFLTCIALLLGLFGSVFLAFRRAGSRLVVSTRNLYLVGPGSVLQTISIEDELRSVDLRRGEGKVVLVTRNKKYANIVLDSSDPETLYREVKEAVAAKPVGILDCSPAAESSPGLAPAELAPLSVSNEEVPPGIEYTHGIIQKLLSELAGSIAAGSRRKK
ncbi:MAG: hypothetical protein AB7W16_05785 [Candidatus Obscuribacterales bacterium]